MADETIIRPGRTSRAFSLVELLVVCAVMSILAALLLPTLEASLAQARTLRCLNTMQQVVTGMVQYTMDAGLLPGADKWNYGGSSYAIRSDRCRYQNETLLPDPDMGWANLASVGYFPASMLLGCPGESGSERLQGDGSNGLYQLGRFGSVHYAYRYNSWIVSLPADRPTLRALSVSTNASKVLVYEDPVFGLHVPGGNFVTEALSMRPNPDNWPHVTGGNVFRHDGSGRFLQNAAFNPPQEYIGWPISRQGDSGGPDTDQWGNITNIPGFLDSLLK